MKIKRFSPQDIALEGLLGTPIVFMSIFVRRVLKGKEPVFQLEVL